MTDLSNTLLVAALDNLPAGVVIMRTDDLDDAGALTPLYANRAADRATGQNLTGDIGRPWRETSPDLAKSRFGRGFLDVLRTGEPWSYLFEYGDSRFSKNWFKGTAARIDDKTLMVSFANVTEQVQAAEEQATAFRALDEFVDVASHDLRAPLRDIKNLSTFVLDDTAGQIDDQSAAHLSSIVERTTNLSRLLDDLLDYSRAARLDDVVDNVNISDLVEEARSLLVTEDRIGVEVDGGDTVIQTARAPLCLVLRNLMQNAVNHHDGEQGRVRLQWKLDDDAIIFTVDDDGPGVPAALREQIFRLFFRTQSSGAGLGLAMARRHVDAVGGEIRVDDSPLGGARFTVTWPRTIERRRVHELN